MDRKILQIMPETRNIIAEIFGNAIEVEMRVFAWALYSDDQIEPLFIDPRISAQRPYGIEKIRESREDAEIVGYVWDQQRYSDPAQEKTLDSYKEALSLSSIKPNEG